MRGRKPGSGRLPAFGQEVFSALAATQTVVGAAQLLGCTAPAIHGRARRNGPIKRAIEEQSKVLEDAIAEALLRHRGVVSKAAEELGVEPSSVRYRIWRSARLRGALADAREGIVDTAEDNVFRAVAAGDLKYSWNLLQTLGKNRGYTERREVDALVTHTVDEASTEHLVAMLDRLAGEHPEAVEAEFSELSVEERSALAEALQGTKQQEAAE